MLWQDNISSSSNTESFRVITIHKAMELYKQTRKITISINREIFTMNSPSALLCTFPLRNRNNGRRERAVDIIRSTV